MTEERGTFPGVEGVCEGGWGCNRSSKAQRPRGVGQVKAIDEVAGTRPHVGIIGKRKEGQAARDGLEAMGDVPRERRGEGGEKGKKTDTEGTARG